MSQATARIKTTSKIYTWNYLEGSGRLDSRVETAWKINDVDVGSDLMDFRDRVVQENGGATEPHEKLVVNFIFVVEGDNQNRGLQTEVEDTSWAALSTATRSQVNPLPKNIVEEALRIISRTSKNLSTNRRKPPIHHELDDKQRSALE